MNGMRLFIGLLVLIMLMLVGGIAWTLWNRSQVPPVSQPPVEFPQPGTATTSTTSQVETGTNLTLSLSDGTTKVVPNFTRSAETKADPQNPGFFLIGEGTAATPHPSYQITYIASTDFFNVSLFAEPLKGARESAERELVATLGLDTVAMCALRYSVATPAFVNESYAGIDLRFSFCPDATMLP